MIANRTIYEKMASALGEEEKIIYQHRVDEISPNMRYCAYNIGDESAIQDLKKMRRNVGQDMLAEKLDVRFFFAISLFLIKSFFSSS